MKAIRINRWHIRFVTHCEACGKVFAIGEWAYRHRTTYTKYTCPECTFAEAEQEATA